MNRIAPFVPRLLIGLFAAAVLIALFILLSPWWPLPHTISDRINLAELVIETAGFSLALFAGIFAAWEFRRSQLGPSLHLSLYDPKRDKTGDSLVTTKDRKKSVPFHIQIHNTGPVVARFVKVHIPFVGKPLFARDHPMWALVRSPELARCPHQEYWHGQDLEAGRAFIFDGKDEYVLHPQSGDLLGLFTLSIEVAHQYPGSPCRVSYQIFADRMSPQSGSFTFQVIEPSE